ncbi:MAG: GNAT family N-acetyltransferase [Hyphomonadaceae bacterium]
MLKLRAARLTLISNDAGLAALQLEDMQAFCRRMEAPAPSAWPPEPFDGGALQWVSAALSADRDGEGWYGWILVDEPGEGAPRRIVGAAALIGRPDDEGEVELGFGILPEARGEGFAGEAIRALKQWALAHGAVRVIVHCDASDDLSLKTLASSGFEDTLTPPYPGVARWAAVAA